MRCSRVSFEYSSIFTRDVLFRLTISNKLLSSYSSDYSFVGSSGKFFKSKVLSNSYLIFFSLINLSKIPVTRVSSQANISQESKFWYYLIDKSLRFPIGVGIIHKCPFYFSGFKSIKSTVSNDLEWVIKNLHLLNK